jgi:hypothetical protein
MNTFFIIMALHLSTTALGAFIVYRRGATPVTLAAIVAWAVLFFPVAYNVARFL